jgi:predicted kinase
MDVPQPPRVILVAGLMASGKSTVAQLLAERLPRSVHLRGDTFRTMIVNGREEFTLPWSDEAWRQVWLRYRLAAAAIEHYLAAGFDVVYQDVFLGPSLAAVSRRLLHHPLHVVVLHPPPHVLAERDAARDKDAYALEPPEAYQRLLDASTPRIGRWLDDADREAEDVVDEILADLDAAAVGPGDFVTARGH